MVKSREYRQAVVIFALMIIIFFYPLLYGRILSQADVIYFFPPWTAVKPQDLSVPSNSVLSDQTREFLTFFKVARESLSQKQVPLWNPYIMAGTPLFANSQSALLFPLNWAFYFLPLYLGFTVSAVLKMFIASLATYAFARKISLSHPAAIMAGTTYTFSIFNVFWLNHPHTNVTIFFPLLLLLAERIKDNPSLSSMAILGLTAGIQLLGGHVEIAFHIAVAVTLFFIFRLMEYRKDRRALSLRIKIFASGYTLGFFLACIVLIPFLEFLFQSATWQVRSDKNPFSLDPMGFVSLFLSDFFIKTGWPFDVSIYHGLSLYAGICPLILSIVILACRPNKLSFFFAGLSLFALAIVFRVPPFFSLLTFLPLFKQAPNFYMVLFHVISVSLLGGMGLDLMMVAVENEALRGRLKKFLISTGFILPLFAASLLLLVLKTSFLSPLMKGLEGLSAQALGHILSQIGSNLARSTLIVGFTFAMLAASCITQRFKGLLGMLAIGITSVDLFMAGAGWNPAIPTRWARPPIPPAITFLQQDKTIYRVAGIGHVMPPNTASFCGLQDIRGYDVPVTDRYHTFFQKALKGKAEWWIYDLPKLSDGSLDFLSLLNVKYILSLEPLPPPLSLVYDKEVKIYENPDALPRCFLAHKMEMVQDGRMALKRVIALGPELKSVVVIEGSFPKFLAALPPSEKEKAIQERVQIVEYTARQVKVDVETSSPGFFILGDTYFPGWKAFMDGKRVPVYRADYLLKAVAVKRGNHRVVFLYQPLSFRIGLGLTIISGVIILWCLRRRKK
jgi:hypothetical protein